MTAQYNLLLSICRCVDYVVDSEIKPTIYRIFKKNKGKDFVLALEGIIQYEPAWCKYC